MHINSGTTTIIRLATKNKDYLPIIHFEFENLSSIEKVDFKDSFEIKQESI